VSRFDFDISKVRERISPKEFGQLISEFNKAKFFSLRDHYVDNKDGCPMVGSPEVGTFITLSLTLDGKSKSITLESDKCLNEDGSAYPPGISALEKRIKLTANLKLR